MPARAGRLTGWRMRGNVNEAAAFVVIPVGLIAGIPGTGAAGPFATVLADVRAPRAVVPGTAVTGAVDLSTAVLRAAVREAVVLRAAIAGNPVAGVAALGQVEVGHELKLPQAARDAASTQVLGQARMWASEARTWSIGSSRPAYA
jgi:hypothetical protein